MRSTSGCLQSAGDAMTSKSGLRRRAVRNTWLPLVQQYKGFMAQFVVGRPMKTSAIALFRRERHLKRDFMFLDHQVCPCSLARFQQPLEILRACACASWHAMGELELAQHMCTDAPFTATPLHKQLAPPPRS